jgi:hypothetical protein
MEIWCHIVRSHRADSRATEDKRLRLHGSSTVHERCARLPRPGTGVRPLGWRDRGPRLHGSEAVKSTAGRTDGKEQNPMSAQQQIFATDSLGVLPSALVVLMTILAMLGVIANAAMA